MNKYLIIILFFFTTAFNTTKEFADVYSGQKGIFMKGHYVAYSEDLTFDNLDKKTKVTYIKEKKKKRMIKQVKVKKLKVGMKLLNGIISYYKRSGYRKKELYKARYKYGVLHGQTEYFDDKMNLKRVECYKLGIPHGYFIDYDSNGEILSNDYFENGILRVKLK